MGRQITNGILLAAALAILFLGGTTILAKIGFLPEEFIDAVLQSMVGLLSAMRL